MAALFAHALGQAPAGPPRWPARVHVEFLRPVPRARLEIDLKLAEGRTLVRFEAAMRASGAVVARASGLLLPLVPSPPTPPEPVGPPSGELARFAWDVPWPGYHEAIDIQVVRGTLCAGPVRVWMRPKGSLVEGAPTGPLERALIVADAASGISAVLDPREYAFVNPDLDVATWRVPRGEWVGLDAATRVGSDGTAVCDTSLFDEDGPFGRATQVLVVRRR